MNVSLVIPVFNNEKTLQKQLTQCLGIMKNSCKQFEILISDDKSTDSTKKILEKFSKDKKIIIFYQKNNLGIARNIHFLYKKARFSYVVLFSIDGGWNPNDIAKFVSAAQRTKADIVIGKRNKKNYSTLRLFISTVYNLLPAILFAVHIYDIGSIKLFKKDMLSLLSLKPTSVAYESEMLIKAEKKGCAIYSVPVSYKKSRKHQSGVSMKLVYQSLVDLVKLRMQGI